jgi:threonylcarbamoyladenosine tRNA methylthiotransferase MtaB
LNQHDTMAMRADLEAAGARPVPPGSAGDVIVVNTCTVTRRADQEARQLIRRLARESPEARIVVTGCYAQRAPEELGSLPGVSAVLGLAERDTIGKRVMAGAEGVAVGEARARRPLASVAPLHFGRTRALLKVQDGCDSFCTYCIVPYVRGRARSLPLADALEQGRRLLGAGFDEIVVTGADLGSYGVDLDRRELLPRLVEGLLALAGTHRVRLSSIEPNKLDPGVVAMLGSEPRLCRHLHLPLQSGSDGVLQAMRRNYRAADYAALLGRIAARGTVGIGADVIVGFPGEGEREFEETMALVADLPLAYLHVFRYSARPETAAVRLEGRAQNSAARERSERLREIGDSKRRTFLRSLIGSRLPVLPESNAPADGVLARSDVYAPVLLRGARSWRGIAEAEITGVEGDALLGSCPDGARLAEAVTCG